MGVPGNSVGNGINWKGQVFPAMQNFTSSNRMTGVGNALKRHYVGYLLEYEQVCAGRSHVTLPHISVQQQDPP